VDAKSTVTDLLEDASELKHDILADAPVNAQTLFDDISAALREKFHLNLSLQNNQKYVYGVRHIADYIASQEVSGHYTIELTREGTRALRIGVKMDGGTEFGHTIHVDGLAYPLKKDRTLVRHGGNINIKEFSERHTLSDGTSLAIHVTKKLVGGHLDWWVHLTTQDDQGNTADFALNNIPNARAKQIIMRARLMKGKLSGIPAKQRKKVLQSFGTIAESVTPQTVVSRLLEDEGDDFKSEILASLPPISITSSHGEFTVDPATGNVLERERYGDDPDGAFIDELDRFDMREWIEYYRMSGDAKHDLDILDIGYWMKNGFYEEPVNDWREQHAQGANELRVRRQQQQLQPPPE